MHRLIQLTLLLLWPLLAHRTVAQRERAVVFTNTTHTLAGTLALPTGNGPHPGIVIVLGSGAINRDGETEGGKPFKLLATDARAALRCLARHPAVDASQIGLIGHSEGATIAAIATTQEPRLAFLLLVNGTCLPGREDILLNTRQRLHKAGLPTSVVTNYLKNMNVYLANPASTPLAIRKAAARQLILAEVDQLPPDQRARITQKDVASSVDAQLRDVSSRWQRQYLVLNPALYYPKVLCPISALFSQSDVEGALRQKIRRFETILRKRKWLYSIKVVRGADHNLLQTDSRGQAPKPEPSVSNEFINLLSVEARKYVTKANART